MTNTPQPIIRITTSNPALSRAEKQRAIAVVLGAAVGDALGAPFEFKPAGRYAERFPEPVLGGIGELIGGGNFGWAPGEFTDDTQMGMALAESIIESGGYDPDVVWSWFRTWRSTARDVGVTTSTSLAHSDWREVAHDPRAAGNGALMRAFPLALAFLHADPSDRQQVVLHQASLTHGDPGAGWGAWIAVEMMCAAILGDDALAIIPSLLDALPTSPVDVRADFAPLLADDFSPDQPHRSNGSVWGCLAEAVWALRTTSTFEDAVVAAVNLGGDADTVACVTGALAGAHYGVQAIPSRWATYVNGRIDSPRGALAYDGPRVQQIALQLLGLRDRPDTPPDVAAGPTEIEPRLFAADLLGASTVPTDVAVVSLCRTGDRFLHHPFRRQVYLIDQSNDHNPGLASAIGDAVDAVDAFLAEGRSVVVHCHGGRSRTGAVLKAWKMRTAGCTEREAHEWLQAKWHRYEDYNQDFVRHLRSLEVR